MSVGECPAEGSSILGDWSSLFNPFDLENGVVYVDDAGDARSPATRNLAEPGEACGFAAVVLQEDFVKVSVIFSPDTTLPGFYRLALRQLLSRAPRSHG